MSNAKKTLRILLVSFAMSGCISTLDVSDQLFPNEPSQRIKTEENFKQFLVENWQGSTKANFNNDWKMSKSIETVNKTTEIMTFIFTDIERKSVNEKTEKTETTEKVEIVDFIFKDEDPDPPLAATLLTGFLSSDVPPSPYHRFTCSMQVTIENDIVKSFDFKSNMLEDVPGYTGCFKGGLKPAFALHYKKLRLKKEEKARRKKEKKEEKIRRKNEKANK